MSKLKRIFKRNQKNIIWFIIGTIIHSISLYVVGYVLKPLDYSIEYLFLTGLGITIISNIVNRFVRNSNIKFKSIVKWTIINTFVIWIVWIALDHLSIINYITRLIITGFILISVFKIINKVKAFRIHKTLLCIILLVLFLYANLSEINFDKLDQQEGMDSNTTDATKSSNFIQDLVKSISEIFSKTIESSCPQINVPMEDGYLGLNIKGKTYDGWSVNGAATCHKGKNEGENLNYYYCGGYTSFLGIGSVNAYVEKTFISEEGEIGETIKYVIWNVYDENKKFLKTKCLGDPDEFEKKQIDSFEKEFLKWR